VLFVYEVLGEFLFSNFVFKVSENFLKSCVKPAIVLSHIFLYQSWYFSSVNTTFILFIEVGIFLCLKSFPLVLSALNDSFKSEL